MTAPKFSPTGHNPACEALAAEMRITLRKIIAFWPRATDMRAVASNALKEINMTNHRPRIRKVFKDELDEVLAATVTKYREHLSMADIIDSLQLALSAAQESGEK